MSWVESREPEVDLGLGIPAPAPSVDRATPKEVYAAIRSQIEHEDNLMTNRLSWLMAAQSFLFMAFAITLNSAPLSDPRAASLQKLLRVLLPVMATLVCASVEITIVAGVIAMARLRAWFAAHGGEAQALGLPPLHGSRRTRAMGMSGPLLMPVLFAAVWIYLLILV